MTAPRISMPDGRPEAGAVFFVTAGAITDEQHRAIALILQGKAAVYEGEDK
jgi:hypothetical protein